MMGAWVNGDISGLVYHQEMFVLIANVQWPRPWQDCGRRIGGQMQNKSLTGGHRLIQKGALPIQ